MTEKSLKLLALAVMWAFSLIALAVCPPYKDAIVGLIFLAITTCFAIYFFHSPKV